MYRLRELTTLSFTLCEWLERIEPNSTTLYDPRIRSKSEHPWASAKMFPSVATSKFRLSFLGCWRCNANGRSQNALPFLPHYSVLMRVVVNKRPKKITLFIFEAHLKKTITKPTKKPTLYFSFEKSSKK